VTSPIARKARATENPCKRSFSCLESDARCGCPPPLRLNFSTPSQTCFCCAHPRSRIVSRKGPYANSQLHPKHFLDRRLLLSFCRGCLPAFVVASYRSQAIELVELRLITVLNKSRQQTLPLQSQPPFHPRPPLLHRLLNLWGIVNGLRQPLTSVSLACCVGFPRTPGHEIGKKGDIWKAYLLAERLLAAHLLCSK
jgi:hypothetical protein